MIHTATDVEPTKITAKTGHTVTSADLKKMFKDAICSGNFFEVSPADLTNGKYQLPRLAHYDRALNMESVVDWLRNTIGMTPYMVHAHFRPFLRRVYETTQGKRHQIFSPDRLYPNEAVAPITNDTLPDFTEDCEWNPRRGPRGHFSHPIFMSTSEATANASPALTDDTATLSVPVTPEDTDMADPGATTANASMVTPQSATAN